MFKGGKMTMKRIMPIILSLVLAIQCPAGVYADDEFLAVEDGFSETEETAGIEEIDADADQEEYDIFFEDREEEYTDFEDQEENSVFEEENVFDDGTDSVAEWEEAVEEGETDEEEMLAMAPEGFSDGEKVSIDACFPDENFRSYIKEKADTDGDGFLSPDEIASVVWIDVNNRKIKSCEGVELFYNLDGLMCNDNELTSLDVRMNTKLTQLSCINNLLDAVDVSANPDLAVLFCNENRIRNLDLSNNPKLERLFCNDNIIEELILGDKKALLFCGCDHNAVSELDISNCPKLIKAVEQGKKSKANNVITYYISSVVPGMDYSEENFMYIDTTTEIIIGGKRCAEPKYSYPSFAPTSISGLENSPARQLNVLVISIDPEITNPVTEERQKATDYFGFSLDRCVYDLINKMENGTNHCVNVNIVDTIWLNEFPKYTRNDIREMTEEQFLKLYPANKRGKGQWAGWGERSREQNILPADIESASFDYEYLMQRCNLEALKNQGVFDMVWLFGIDPMNAYETAMVGRNRFWINGDGCEADCDNFVIAGLTFSRIDGTIHSLGHYFEHVLADVYKVDRYEDASNKEFSELNNYEKFYLNKLLMGNHSAAGVGLVHTPPNGVDNYDWENPVPVQSYHGEFLTDYPNITGTKTELFTPDEYLGDYEDVGPSFIVWWMRHFPHFEGRDSEGYLMNWWKYILDLKYTIDVSSAYDSASFTLAKGDVIEDLKIVATCHDGRHETISVHESGAPVVVDNESVIRYENGNLTALSQGTANISIKYDGFEVVYEVTVQDHVYGSPIVVKEATCTETGISEKVCSACGEKAQEIIPATGHNWESDYTIDKPASCEEEGSETIHCSVCGEIKEGSSRPVPKTDHKYGEWAVTKAATCTEKGMQEKACIYCCEAVEEDIPASGHKWNSEYTIDVEATSTSTGRKSIHCTVCDMVKEGSEIVIPVIVVPSTTPEDEPSKTPEEVPPAAPEDVPSKTSEDVSPKTSEDVPSSTSSASSDGSSSGADSSKGTAENTSVKPADKSSETTAGTSEQVVPVKKVKASITASKTSAKYDRKATVKISSNSGADLSVTGRNRLAKNGKYVRIKNGKTAKLVFKKNAPKGKYKFKVISAAVGNYKRTTKTITIKIK